ncbi:MAG: protein kinase [Candidatus Zixiibacteriota bacterium]
MQKDKEEEKHTPTVPIIRSTPKPPPVPQDFGEYLKREEVGCGGMGWIFKAVHKKLDVIHAIKILHPALSQHEEFVTNFKREAQLAAKLQHPNIVIIHNTGKFAGFHYIAMEFIDGVNLAKKLPGKGMPHPVVLAIAVKILDALDHAHNYEFSYQSQTYYGLIHQDIKPENVLIDSTGEVKITDFGIAKGIHLYGDITTEGTIVGTPSYMSPEQIDGAEITHTTDIYSLGVLMYELLSGKKAFDGTTTQIIKRISNHEYEPLDKIKRKIPNEIIKIVDKAMSFNSKDRYQSAYEMRVAINRYLSHYQYDDPTGIIRRYFVEQVTPPIIKREKRKIPTKLLAGAGKVIGIITLIFIIFLGLFYLNKIRIRGNAKKALAGLSEKLEKSQTNNASLDFEAVLSLLDSANAVFSLKDYGGTRALCDSATGILDSLIILRRRGIRTRYERVADKVKKAEDSGSTFDFRGVYLFPTDSLIEIEEFDRADSFLNEALAEANREIWRLTKIEEGPPPEEELAQRKLRNVKDKLAVAKRDRPDINFFSEDSLITQAEEFLKKRRYAESMKKSEEAGRAIARKMIPAPPCPRVESANRHYEMLSSEQKEKLKRDRRRMNELANAGQCKAADVFAKNILDESIKREEKKEEEEKEYTDAEYFARAENLERNGDWKGALNYYEKVRRAETKSGSWEYYLPARFRMGVIYQNYDKKYTKAISEFKRVLDLGNRNYFEACYQNIGVCFYEISQYDSAIAYFKEVERNKNLISPNLAKGEHSYYDTDLWHDAMYYWASALTKLYYKEKDPEKKKQLRTDAIHKWEADYLDYYRKDRNDPRRGPFVANAEVELRNLRH